MDIKQKGTGKRTTQVGEDGSIKAIKKSKRKTAAPKFFSVIIWGHGQRLYKRQFYEYMLPYTEELLVAEGSRHTLRVYMCRKTDDVECNTEEVQDRIYTAFRKIEKEDFPITVSVKANPSREAAIREATALDDSPLVTPSIMESEFNWLARIRLLARRIGDGPIDDTDPCVMEVPMGYRTKFCKYHAAYWKKKKDKGTNAEQSI